MIRRRLDESSQLNVTKGTHGGIERPNEVLSRSKVSKRVACEDASQPGGVAAGLFINRG